MFLPPLQITDYHRKVIKRKKKGCESSCWAWIELSSQFSSRQDQPYLVQSEAQLLSVTYTVSKVNLSFHSKSKMALILESGCPHFNLFSATYQPCGLWKVTSSFWAFVSLSVNMGTVIAPLHRLLRTTWSYTSDSSVPD